MLEIRDPKLLAALQRALYEAKFERAAEDALEIAGSPFVAEACRQVVAAHIAASNARDAALTEKWLRAEGRPRELEIVRQQIRLTERWLKMKDDAKAAYVRDLLSPLVAPDELVAAMVTEGDSYHRQRG